MKWRHWSIVIVLLLLNYLVFSAALTRFTTTKPAAPVYTRTPQPTYAVVNPVAITRIIAVTNTPWSPSSVVALAPTASATVAPSPTISEPTPIPPTATPVIIYIVKRGDTLGAIAQRYGVTVSAIVRANGLKDPHRLNVSQKLIIPVPGQAAPTATSTPTPQ
jgi:LysM repeat protein